MKALLSYWQNDNLKLLFALGLSQLTQFLTMLLQIRYYGVGEFGKISLLVSLSLILSLVLRAGVVTSISILIARESYKVGEPIFALAAYFAIISSIIISLTAYLFGKSLFDLLGFSLTNDNNLILLLMGYFILYEYAENLLKGAGKVSILVALIVISSVTIISLSAILIYLDADWHIQFVVRSITQGSLSLLVILSLVRRIELKFSLVKQLINSLQDVGVVVWLSSLTGAISGRLNEFALALFFTPEISGTYKFLSALTAPAKLITNAISKTNFKNYSSLPTIPLIHQKVNNLVAIAILSLTIPIAIFGSIYLKIPIMQLLLPAFLATLASSISSSWAIKLTFLEVHNYGMAIFKGGVLSALVHMSSILLFTSKYSLHGALLADILAALTFFTVVSKKYRGVINDNNIY